MDRKEIVDIIVNQKRTYIDDESYRKFQEELISDMLRSHKTTDTLVTGMLDMFDHLDEIGYKVITLGEFIEILRKIDYKRNCKLINKLSKTKREYC